MEKSERPEKIISQAAQWNFEGDCSLLAWMQELSQNLEQRATATSDALQKLSVNVNRTAIALDNAANSLTALQYTQFVESRCHDDDETLTNTSGVMPVEVATTASDKSKSTTEVMATFLRKNLQMLHNSHEKYALDFEDSDEDENATATNYIYQPKNPLNDGLLPHIYGSKLWKEHWHVGLCDGSNEYSGDEASDAFSESPSSSATDNESYESNTPNLSEWASSTSIPIEHKHPAQLASHSVSTGVIVAQEKRLTAAQQHPSNDDSDTNSTTSRSTTTNPTTIVRDHDLFGSLRHESPVTSTSASSSPQKYATPPLPIQTRRNVGQASTMLPPFIDATPPTEIFADTSSVQQAFVYRANQSLQKQLVATQTTRKPVNLFDDDDFNSFMTEAVDKPQEKVDQQAQLPIPAARNLPTKKEASVPVQQAAAPKKIDLFDESLNDKVPVVNRTKVPLEIEKPTEIKQRQPINLFDSPEGSPPSDMLFAAPVDNVKKDSGAVVPAAKPSITAKSLFDDDEDDDDFLNVFGSKKLNLPQRTTGKTLLFDDDNEKIIPPSNQNLRLTSNLFDDIPPVDVEVSSVAPFKKDETKKTSDSGTLKESASSSVLQNDSTALSKKDSVEDFEEQVSAKSNVIRVEVRTKQKTLKPPSAKPTNKLFSADLFGNDDTNDLDDLLGKQSSKENISQTVEPKDLPIKDIIQQKKPLFVDDFEDDDDLFNKILTNTTNNIADNVKIIEAPKRVVPSENTQSAVKPAGGAYKSDSLFADDFDDYGHDDLFGVKPNAQVTSKKEIDVNKQDIVVKNSTNILLEQNAEADKKNSSATDNLKSIGNESQPGLLFEHDLNGGRAGLMPNATKSTEDSSSVLNETNADINDPAVMEKAINSDSADIDTLQSESLFGVNAVPSRSVSLKSQTTLISSDMSKQMVIGVEKDQHDAETPNIEASNLANTPKESEAISGVEKINNNLMTTDKENLDANRKSYDFTKLGFALPKKDMTAELASNETISIPADTDTQSILSKANDAGDSLKYSGIFLDEPPDDDDFFTTLSNNSKQISVSKLTLDLENEFYEPALPQAPKITAGGTISQNDGNNKHEAGSSDYGGLRLFSEIPPDDDGDDFTVAAPSKDSAEIISVNQRLHNVFYDDFTETLAAVQQMKENKIVAHALFDDEPPVDEGQFDIVEKVSQAKLKAKKSEETENVNDLAKQKQVVTDRVLMDIVDDEEKQMISSNGPTKDETDRAVQKEIAETHHATKKTLSSGGKLQMPNIKINVQALLPGIGGGPSFKKPSQQSSVLDNWTDISETPAELSKALTNPSVISSTSSSCTNENLLQNVCKTRVRVPAGRRPSTRRARQENYRQSIIAEQADLGEEGGGSDDLTKASVLNSSSKEQPKEQIVNVTQKFSNKPVTEKLTVQAVIQANLFVEDDDDVDFLFNPSHKRNITSNIPRTSLDAHAPLSMGNNIHTHTSNEQTLSTQATDKNLSSFSKDFMENNDNKANDIFKNVRVAPINTPHHTIQAGKENSTTTNARNITTEISATKAATTTTKSLFDTPSSEDSDDDIFKSSKSVPAAAKPKTTKAVKTSSETTTTTAAMIETSAASVNTQAKTTIASVRSKNKLDSIFGSDDDEDDDFLSNLNAKKKTITNLLTSSGSGVIKQAAASSGGLFSDIESDEDDLFGGKSKSKQDAAMDKKTITPKSQMPPASSMQKSVLAKSTSASNNPPKTLADNPLADLLKP